MRYFSIIIFLSCFRIVSAETITLLNSEGTTKKPKDLSLDASWIGLAISSQDSTDIACTAIHVDLESVTLHKDCIPKKGTQATLRLYFWNKSGAQIKFDVPSSAYPKDSEEAIQIVKIPKQVVQEWALSGDSPRQNDLWFGGFHPEWELVRLYSFEADPKGKIYHFQVNTCKSASRSPVLKRVKLATEEDDEEVLSETRLIPENSPYAKVPVLEKCIRPFSKSSRGALMTLARDFNEKMGFLITSSFEGVPQRELATFQAPPKFQDGTLLRYIGADGLETNLPKNPADIELNFSFTFEKLFPQKIVSGR